MLKYLTGRKAKPVHDPVVHGFAHRKAYILIGFSGTIKIWYSTSGAFNDGWFVVSLPSTNRTRDEKRELSFPAGPTASLACETKDKIYREEQDGERNEKKYTEVSVFYPKTKKAPFQTKRKFDFRGCGLPHRP